MHTEFETLSSESLARLRNEIIKQARVLSVYNHLSADIMVHVVLDVIRIRHEHAKILGGVFSDSTWQRQMLRAHDIGLGRFTNQGVGIMDKARNLLSLTGRAVSFSLPSFQ